MSVNIQAADLYRIIWNALLFTDKTSPTGPVVEFNLQADTLTVRSADKYSGLIERWYLDQFTGITGVKWYSQKEDLKEVSKKLRVDPTGTFNILSLFEREVPCPHPGAWHDFDTIIQDTQPIREATTVAISHDRWKLLGRVRPGGDYPIVFRVSELPHFEDDTDDTNSVEFKIGPHIRGYVAPVDAEFVLDEWGF